jgi:hypothetical protein
MATATTPHKIDLTLPTRTTRPPSPPPTKEAIEAAWKRLSKEENAYMQALGEEVTQAVYATIEENKRTRKNNPVVVFLNHRLSESAEFILKADGYKIRLWFCRSIAPNGAVMEHLKPAIVMF